MTKPLNLFTVTFIVIIVVYLFVFGESKTIELIKTQYLYILGLIPLGLIFIYCRFKLKDYEIIDFNKNAKFSFSTSVIFFVIFQIVDYIQEDGFIGMISQWFFYWVMGIIALFLMKIINYYKNYKVYCL
ncbi:MAG: hypothetical protein PHE16_05630 [Aliarcobacter sp.]|nr:hypothetical protein [Aliarcobacter sp.]